MAGEAGSCKRLLVTTRQLSPLPALIRLLCQNTSFHPFSMKCSIIAQFFFYFRSGSDREVIAATSGNPQIPVTPRDKQVEGVSLQVLLPSCCAAANWLWWLLPPPSHPFSLFLQAFLLKIFLQNLALLWHTGGLIVLPAEWSPGRVHSGDTAREQNLCGTVGRLVEQLL